MSRRILVAGNCQVFGISAALKAYFPDSIITPRHGNVQIQELSNFDVIVYDVFSDNAARVFEEVSVTSTQLIKYCRLKFHGFHPDLCRAKLHSTNEFTAYRLNSAIAVWAYRNGLSVDEAESMFQDEVFDALGYFDCYDKDLRRMRNEFAGTDISFDRLFLCLKRTGIFMHTFNHPRIDALVALTRLIAEKLDESAADRDHFLGIPDGLTTEIWPVYPELAAEHALTGGSYNWKIKNAFVYGLKDYLRTAFAQFESNGIKPKDEDLEAALVSGIPPSLYDNVLSNHAARSVQ